MAAPKIQSSTYNPVYNTSTETGNLLVEIVGSTGGDGGTGGGSTPTPTQPTIYTISTLCLTDPLVERSIALTGVKKLSINSRTNTPFRLSPVVNNTINTQNFETVNSGIEYFQDDINFTGTLYISSDIIPTALTISNCITTASSSTITSANSFNSIIIGQSVGGTGIPANTFVIARSVNGLSITLGNSDGLPINATADGNVTLTFGGAVIRISKWS